MICMSVTHQSREESVSDFFFREFVKECSFRVLKNSYCLISRCFEFRPVCGKLVRLACCKLFFVS